MNKDDNTYSQFRKIVTIQPRSSHKVNFASMYPVQVTGISISRAEARYLEIDRVLFGTLILQESQRGLTFADDAIHPYPIDSSPGRREPIILCPGMCLTVDITNWRKTKPVSFWIRLDTLNGPSNMPDSRTNPIPSVSYDPSGSIFSSTIESKLMDTKCLLQGAHDILSMSPDYHHHDVLADIEKSLHNINELLDKKRKS